MSSRSEVAVRAAVPADAPALAAIFGAAINDQAPPFYTAAQVEAWAAALTAERALALIGAYTTYVAEVGDAAVVGFATFAEPGEFDMLYVHPDHIGRGIGARLAAVVEQHAHGRGVHELRATVSDCARLAFESFGFRHEQPQTATLGDQSFAVTRMSKSLG
jgi:putative acetyltransferase